ncbi:MAG TPA: hypothetical protein VIV40_06465 [Kofleriaceae bacterium]
MVAAITLSSAACRSDDADRRTRASSAAQPSKPASPLGAASAAETTPTAPATTPSSSELSPPSPEELADCPSIADFKSVERCAELCNGAHENACYVAGLAYIDGDKVERSAAKAHRYFALGCQLNSGAACKWLGKLETTGDGNLIKPNAERAAKTFEQARARLAKECSRKSALSCSELAGMFDEGLGGAPDKATAATYRKQACDLGMSKDCTP